jgi:prevent-host-death family protein
MNAVSVSELRGSLPELLKKVETTHEPLMVTRHGKAVAQLIPAETKEKKRYALRGKPIWISPDFDESMDELLDLVSESKP